MVRKTIARERWTAEATRGLGQTHQAQIERGEENRHPGQEIVMTCVLQNRVEGESCEGRIG